MRSEIRIVTFVALSILVVGCAGVVANRQVRRADRAPKLTVRGNRFGVSLSYGYDQRLERAFRLAVEAEVGWVRAVLNWSTFDQMIGYARANELQMVGGLGYATNWNIAAPSSETRQGRQLIYLPADLKT